MAESRPLIRCERCKSGKYEKGAVRLFSYTGKDYGGFFNLCAKCCKYYDKMMADFLAYGGDNDKKNID